MENQKTTSFKCLNALGLKLLAMALMLSDHIWYVFLQDKEGFQWMTYIGRIAFPIFAFQIVEGFAYTHNFKKYWSRVFCSRCSRRSRSIWRFMARFRILITRM